MLSASHNAGWQTDQRLRTAGFTRQSTITTQKMVINSAVMNSCACTPYGSIQSTTPYGSIQSTTPYGSIQSTTLYGSIQSAQRFLSTAHLFESSMRTSVEVSVFVCVFIVFEYLSTVALHLCQEFTCLVSTTRPTTHR